MSETAPLRFEVAFERVDVASELDEILIVEFFFRTPRIALTTSLT